MKFLIVEDMPDEIGVMKSQLELNGHEVVVVTNPSQLSEVLIGMGEKPFDAILLDNQLMGAEWSGHPMRSAFGPGLLIEIGLRNPGLKFPTIIPTTTRKGDLTSTAKLLEEQLQVNVVIIEGLNKVSGQGFDRIDKVLCEQNRGVEY